MSKDEPLRGEAAWKAAKQDVAKRNEAAHGSRLRLAQEEPKRATPAAADERL